MDKWKRIAVVFIVLFVIAFALFLFLLYVMNIVLDTNAELICDRGCDYHNYASFALHPKGQDCMCQDPIDKNMPFRIWIDGNYKIFWSENESG